MSKKNSTPATPATKDLKKRGVPFECHSYDFDPGALGIGEQAAKALGIAPDRLFKTLIVMIDGKQIASALTPVDAETRMKQLAGAFGGKRAAMATMAEAERATGYIKGGISPFGQRQKLKTVVDRSIENHETIFVNGGRRGLQIEIASNDLLTGLDAILADLAR